MLNWKRNDTNQIKYNNIQKIKPIKHRDCHFLPAVLKSSFVIKHRTKLFFTARTGRTYEFRQLFHKYIPLLQVDMHRINSDG